MILVLVGLNFRSAPIEVREKIYFSAEDFKTYYLMATKKNIKEIVILSTCNRVEIYSCGTNGTEIIANIMEFICKYHKISQEKLEKHLYKMLGAKALLHLFKVSSSLNSMVIGENQILGQVKKAYELATLANTCGTYLNKIFQQSIAVGKKTRTQTNISKGGVSIGSVAVDLIKEVYEKDSTFTICLVGAGEMAEEVLKSLFNHGKVKVFICNRSFNKATILSKNFGGIPEPLSNLYKIIPQCDVVISSTASFQFMVEKSKLQEVLLGRSKFIFFIDLSVPRNIDPLISNLDDIVIYTVDDLQKVILTNKNQRNEEVNKVLEIINQALVDFNQWKIKQIFAKFLNTNHFQSSTNLLNYVRNTQNEVASHNHDIHLILTEIIQYIQEKQTNQKEINLKDLFAFITEISKTNDFYQ